MITMYPVPGKEKSKLICQAFLTGAPRSAEGSAFFGTEGVMDQFQSAKRSGKPWYYIDNAYFDKHRGIYFRVTKNALQHSGQGEPKAGGARFTALKIDIKPWRTISLGNDVLVVPQSMAFMKSTIGRPTDWTRDTLERLQAWGTWGVRVRPWTSDKVKAGISLLADLKNLRLLVTYSSASAITAMLEGVPAISETGAAHLLTGPLTREAVLDPPRSDDRYRFAAVLADNQFTLEEFRSGRAWEWLQNP